MLKTILNFILNLFKTKPSVASAEITEPVTSDEIKSEEITIDLVSLTKKELGDYALDNFGIELNIKLKKDVLIEQLQNLINKE